MLRLRNCLLPLLHGASPLPFHIHPHACRRLSISFPPSPSPATFFLEGYLVASCGLAPAQAREVSKKAARTLSGGSRRRLDELSYSRLYSASNPDAILDLLSGAGLSRADIAAVVTADPLLLRASVKNIAPRLLALRDRVGLSPSQVARFLVVGSGALRGCDVIPRLEFLISFYGSFEQVLVLCKDKARLLTFSPERVKEFLQRAEELGVPPTSRMFRQAVAAVADNTKEKVAAKLEFFQRTLGSSKAEVSTAVSKMPKILGLSEEILLRKIEFLVNEVSMEPQYIVERPILLAYSLEKRLVPRHFVMKVLQEKGLLNSNMSFSSLASYAEDTFKSKFIDCHKESVPGFADAYAAARAGIVPSRV